MRKDERPLFCRPLEHTALAPICLLWFHVKLGAPRWMLQVERVECRIRNVQQLLSFRQDSQGHVTRRVPWRSHRLNAWEDLLRLFTDEADPILKSLKVLSRDLDEAGRRFFAGLF